MVDRQTRVKKKRFRRTPGGKTVKHYSRYKITYAQCAITGEKLQGTGNQFKSRVTKKGRTHRRPSVKFGGILSSGARREVWENYALVETGKKQAKDVPAKFRNYVKIKSGAQ